MRLRTLFSMLSAVLLLAVFPAAGQEATVISSQVLSAADSQPLPGAAVSIPELSLSAPSPTATSSANSNLGIFTYPSHSPFGMNGRFVYSRVSYTF